MSDDKKSEDHVVDSELNDLLDSALEDFNKTTTLDAKDDDGATSKPVSSKDDTEEAASVDADDMWTEDFIKQAADQFEKSLEHLMQNGLIDDLGAYLEKMPQTVTNAVLANANTDFCSAVAQALKDLSVSYENLQNEPDIPSMLEELKSDENTRSIASYMQFIMQSLLSKEILYSALKDLLDTYPEWLEKKKATLPSADLQRYTKQLELMQKVCGEFEKGKDTDTEETKKQRFETIISLMQDMQTCGQPPEELVGEQPAFFQFDGEGNPVMPELPPGVKIPQNCCIM